MASNISAISAGSWTGTEIGWELVLPSLYMALFIVSTKNWSSWWTEKTRRKREKEQYWMQESIGDLTESLIRESAILRISTIVSATPSGQQTRALRLTFPLIWLYVFISHHVPVGLDVTHANIFHVGGERLIKPQVIPPLHRHQVTEPLKRARTSHLTSLISSARRTTLNFISPHQAPNYGLIQFTPANLLFDLSTIERSDT